MMEQTPCSTTSFGYYPTHLCFAYDDQLTQLSCHHSSLRAYAWASSKMPAFSATFATDYEELYRPDRDKGVAPWVLFQRNVKNAAQWVLMPSPP